MQLHNPLNVSRFCPGLGRNLEAFEVRDVPASFKRCGNCACVISGEKGPRKSTGVAKK